MHGLMDVIFHFLNGGDRIMQHEERASSVQGAKSGSEASHLAIQYDQSGLKDNTLSLFGTSLTPTSVLLVMNLPTVIFFQVPDFHPPLCPFGRIKKLKILDSNFEDALTGKTSVLVDYAAVASAMEAKEMSHFPLQVAYIQIPSTRQTVERATSGSNPFAQPFLQDSRSALLSAHKLPLVRNTQHIKFAAAACNTNKTHHPSSLGNMKPNPHIQLSKSSSTSSR